MIVIKKKFKELLIRILRSEDMDGKYYVIYKVY